MNMRERETRLMESFVALLGDHRKDFEGFVRDVENVRYCHTPIDGQQLARCEYALRNMEMRLLTIHRCIDSKQYGNGPLDELVKTKNEWEGMKARVDSYLQEIQQVIEATTTALRPVRRTLEHS